MNWMGSGTQTEWIVFTAVVGLMLFVDLFLLNRKDHVIKPREALLQTGMWITVSLLFGGYIWYRHGQDHATLYVTGFVIEKALSVDNLFVFLVVFSFFRVPAIYQRRVLSWGILTAVVLRAVLIFVGAWLIDMFHWILYIFGAFLLYTAWKLVTKGDEEVHPEDNRVLKLIRRFMPMSNDYDGHHFFTRLPDKRLAATPLLAVLAVVETTDVVFALDSVPAIFAITTDPFLVYTSNIFAILGLRALYFALAAMMGKFKYLNYGLALVLAFVGGKMLAEYWHLEVPPAVSLLIVMGCLVGSVVVSLLYPDPATDPKPPPMEPGPTHYGDTEQVKKVETKVDTKGERPAEG